VHALDTQKPGTRWRREKSWGSKYKNPPCSLWLEIRRKRAVMNAALLAACTSVSSERFATTEKCTRRPWNLFALSVCWKSKRRVLHQAGFFGSSHHTAHTALYIWYSFWAAGSEKWKENLDGTVLYGKKELVKHACELSDNFSCGILPKVFTLAKVKEGFSMLRVDKAERSVLKARWPHAN